MLIPEDMKCEFCEGGFTPDEERDYYLINGKYRHKTCHEQRQAVDPLSTPLSSKEKAILAPS